MKRKNMDEPTAYRTMQKMAMDRSVRLVSLARDIIPQPSCSTRRATVRRAALLLFGSRMRRACAA